MTLTVKVSPGKHTIKLVKNGYFTVVKEVTVSAGETKDISINLVETNRFTNAGIFIVPSTAKVGENVTIDISVKNTSSYVTDRAKVQITYDGKTDEKMTDPILPGNVKSVRFTIKFDSAGTKTIDIKFLAYVQDHENGSGWYVTDTATARVTVTEREATINISTTPSGAAVYIDGVYKGTT